MGLGDPEKGDLSYDLRQYGEPHTAENLAMLLVSAHSAKYDLISLMAAAIQEAIDSCSSEPSPRLGSSSAPLF